mgnify:CR=1 FL=1|tara:strand:- start:15 stop:203 length:189 start_codon:yes stop_codon:yes gene_type:complete
MSAELQTLSIGITTFVLCWLLNETTNIAEHLGLKKPKYESNIDKELEIVINEIKLEMEMEEF